MNIDVEHQERPREIRVRPNRKQIREAVKRYAADEMDAPADNGHPYVFPED